MTNDKLTLYLVNIVYLAILLTLLCNIGEVFLLMQGYFNPRIHGSVVVTPPYVRISKDLCMALVFLVSAIILIKNGIFNLTIGPLYPFLLVLIFYSLAGARTNLIYLFSGLRWVYPFFLPFFLSNFMSTVFLSKVAKLLQLIFLVSIILQVFQLFSKYDFYGMNHFGYPNRLPGIFFIPSTLAAFNCVCFCFFFFYFKSSFIKKVLCFVLIPLSTYFTASGTGIIVLFIIMLTSVLFFNENKPTLFNFKFYKIMLPFISVVALLLLPVITSRNTIISVSGNSRVTMFLDLLKRSDFFSSHFGQYTNTLASLSAYYNSEYGFVVVDSTWGNILGNFGIFGLIISLILMIFWAYLIFISNDVTFFCFSVVAFCFSLTSSITESFPLYLLLAIYFGYFFKNNNLNVLLQRHFFIMKGQQY